MWSITFTIFAVQLCQFSLAQGNNQTETPQDCKDFQAYDTDLKLCVRDCNLEPNSQHKYDQSNYDICECVVDFIWDFNQNLCVRDCQGVTNSNGVFQTSNVTKCKCNGGWAWNSASGDCSTYVCQSHQIWIDLVSACGRDCTNVTNSKKITNLAISGYDQCICDTGYVWNPTSKICVIDCAVMTTDPQCQVSCASQCGVCSSSGCTQCQSGYTLLASGKCFKCLRGCSGTCEATNITNCLSCAQGYFIRNFTCIKCPSGCQSCSSQSVCTACYDGYDLKNNTCTQKCKFPCETCNNNNCLTCVTGYFLQGTKCAVNTTCIPSVCGNCPVGTFGNPGSCTACPTSCKTCSSATVCADCMDGYYHTSNNTCPTCPVQCKTCSRTDYCSICSDGYVAIDKNQNGLICSVCSGNCLTCIETPSQCDTCKTGFRLLNAQCYNNYNVGCQFSFDADFDTFFTGSNFDTFLSRFTILCKKPLKNFIIQSIRRGSVIVNGSLTVDTAEQAISLTTLILKEVESDPNVFGVPVITSNAVALNDEEPLQTTNPSALSNSISTVGIVLGVVIPVVVVAIVASAIVWIKKSKTSSELEKNMFGQKPYDQIQINESEPPMVRNQNIL